MSFRLSWEEAIARGYCSASEAPTEKQSAAPKDSSKPAKPKRESRSASGPAIDYPDIAWLPRETHHSRALQSLLKRPDLLSGNKEHFDQVYIFHFFEIKYPDLHALLHATPNAGRRKGVERGHVLSEGLRKGYPDMSLDAARGGYHGLRCELKRKDAGQRSISEDQRAWIERLTAEGYLAFVAFGWEEAIDCILKYWKSPQA